MVKSKGTNGLQKQDLYTNPYPCDDNSFLPLFLHPGTVLKVAFFEEKFDIFDRANYFNFGEDSKVKRGHCDQSLEKEFAYLLQDMLSCCHDIEFLPGTKSRNDFKKDKYHTIERNMEVLKIILKSEVWQTGFRKAIETLPILTQTTMANQDGCQACSRRGGIASKILTFTGSAYNHKNFKSQETSLPSKMSFAVSKHCARRSQLYHGLFHYKFHLHQRCVEADFVFDKQWIKETYHDFSSLMHKADTWVKNVCKWR